MTNSKTKEIDNKQNALLFVLFDYLVFLAKGKLTGKKREELKNGVYKSFLNGFNHFKKIEKEREELTVGRITFTFFLENSLSKMTFETKCEFIEYCFSKLTESIDLRAFEYCRSNITGELNDFEFVQKIKQDKINTDFLPLWALKIYKKSIK